MKRYDKWNDQLEEAPQGALVLYSEAAERINRLEREIADLSVLLLEGRSIMQAMDVENAQLRKELAEERARLDWVLEKDTQGEEWLADLGPVFPGGVLCVDIARREIDRERAKG